MTILCKPIGSRNQISEEIKGIFEKIVENFEQNCEYFLAILKLEEKCVWNVGKPGTFRAELFKILKENLTKKKGLLKLIYCLGIERLLFLKSYVKFPPRKRLAGSHLSES